MGYAADNLECAQPHGRRDDPRRARLRDLTISVLAILAVFGLIAVLLMRILAAQHTMATLTATNQAGMPHAGGPAVGALAPDFALTVWNPAPGAARTVELSALTGHPVVVNLWAPWCGPCQQEAPLLAAAARTEATRGVIFLGVAFDTNQQDVIAFLQRAGIRYPCGPDPHGAIAAAYALPGIPVTIFVDRQGRITQKSIGPLTVDSLHTALVAIER